MPATRDIFRDIFDLKMFMSRDSRGGNYKSIVFTPPLDGGERNGLGRREKRPKKIGRREKGSKKNREMGELA